MSAQPQVERASDRKAAINEVAIVGAGYLGVPLVQVLAGAGRSDRDRLWKL